MPKVREVMGHVSVETAKGDRICHRNRKSHGIAKGELCLVIREAASSGSKNYCLVCAAPILEQAAQDRLAAINERRPEGIRYASTLLPDGETFLAFLELEDGVENPLPTFPEWRDFLEGVEDSRAEPAEVQPLEVVGSYRLF